MEDSVVYTLDGLSGLSGTQNVNVTNTDLAKEVKQDDLITLLTNVINNNRAKVETGKYATNYSAWGEPIVVEKYSLGHGLFTFSIPTNYYIKYLDDVEIQTTALDNYIRSERGKLVISADTLTQRHTLRSKRAYGYQPNRGHIYSDSAWLPNAGAGKLYFVTRRKLTDTVSDVRVEVTDKPADISKGNVYDIQFQWRGAGDYYFYSNLLRRAIKENLGTTTELTITNPVMPFFCEAVRGAHTLGGLARTGSAVRWGLSTPENGIFWELEYEDTRAAQIEIGCWDVSTEGGKDEDLMYGSVPTGDITSNNGERPSLALRIPLTRSVFGGFTWVNTRSVELAAITVGQADQSIISVYVTRNTAAVTITAGAWAYDNVTGSCEYAINDDGGVIRNFTFDKTKATLLFQTKVELNVPIKLTNPLDGRGKFWLAPGDILVILHNTAGVDLVNVTVEFGAEI